MSILTVTDIRKSFGGWEVLNGVTFTVNAGERAGLVGRNGAGKTTLLRLIAELDEPDGGTTSRLSGSRLGYLSQDPELDPDSSLIDAVAKVFLPLHEMEERLRQLEHEMAAAGTLHSQGHEGTEERLERLMNEYSRLTERFESGGGYDTRSRTRATLFGLGFNEEELSKKTGLLSGGQRMRAGLAMLLLSEPDLLILDEPTNHLDLQSTEWLEEYLRTFKGALLLVSHDRYFLDRIATKIVELDRGQAKTYAGNFSAYRATQEAELLQQADAYRRQQEEVARIRAFIEKNRAGQLSKQSKSRQKMLERMELIEKPRSSGKVMGVNFGVSRTTGEEVFAARDLAKAFGERTLFDGLDMDLDRGQRLGLVGPNGAGKTTFLKVIKGELEPTAGSYEWGAGVELGYFSQDLSGLDDRQTVLDEILDASDLLIGEARSLLGRFLFSGEDVYKLVGTLSGGERNRLAMAKLMISGANVLLLDEPTNHLDMESKTALEEALLDFPGTLIFVSHDRYFIDRLATHLLVLGEGRPRVVKGNYSGYRAQRTVAAASGAGSQRSASGANQGSQGEAAATGAGGRATGSAGQGTGAASGVGAGADSASGELTGRQARQLEKARRQAEKRAAEFEAEVTRLEAARADLEHRLADPSSYAADGGRELVAEYEAVKESLERAMRAWEEALEEAQG